MDSNNNNQRTRRSNPPAMKFNDEQDKGGNMRGFQPRNPVDFMSLRPHILNPAPDLKNIANMKPSPTVEHSKLKQFKKPDSPSTTEPPKILNSAYQRNNVVLISGDNVDDIYLANNTVNEILGCYDKLRIEVKKKVKEYKVQGSYIWAEDLCSFEAQLWKIPTLNGKGQSLAYELKKKSMMGDVAFTDLVQKVAWHLKEKGFATVMADNEEILRPMTELERASYDEKISEFDDFGEFDESDFAECGLDDFPADTPLSMFGSANAVTGIRLNTDDDLIRHWERILSMGDYNLMLDTLKTISRAAKHKDNAKVLAAKHSLLDCAVKELSKVKDAQIVHTALSLVQSLIQSGNEAARSFLCEHDIIAVLSDIFLTFTGCSTEKKAKKVQSNPVVAETSLKILNCLIDAESGSFEKKSTNTLKNALSVVEDKVKDQYVKNEMISLQEKLRRVF